MTETSPSGTFTPMRGMRKAGSCGMPVPGVMLQVRRRHRSDEVRPARRARRDLHPRPQRHEGLLEQPEATADVMTADGYMRTGDVAYMDEDGFVFIVDRIKDMLLVRRLQRLPAQHRRGDLHAPVGRRGVGDRHPRRVPRPVAQGVHRAQAERRGAVPHRRAQGVPARQARQARDGRAHRVPRRAAPRPRSARSSRRRCTRKRPRSRAAETAKV